MEERYSICLCYMYFYIKYNFIAIGVQHIIVSIEDGIPYIFV